MRFSMSTKAMLPVLAVLAVAGTPAHAASPSGPATPWWHAFHDATLDEAVDRALAGNLDLAAAAARIEQARAMAKSAGAALLPSVTLGASAEAASQSLNTPFGAVSQALGLSRGYDLYQVGPSAQWEIDLFGGLSARRRSSLAQAGATVAEADAARLAVVAETADTYLRLRGLQARLDFARQQQKLSADLAALVRQRAGQGLASDHDANRAEAASAAASAAISPLRSAIAVEIDRLGVLTAGDAAWRDRLQVAGEIPAALEPALDADPARLMRRRPDLAAAEQRVQAARANVGAARSEYYPHLSLGGLIGLASLGTASLTSGDAVTAQGGATLRWRLFDFGRVDAEVASARGREHEVLALWRQAALSASAEVADAIAALAEGRNEQAELLRQVALLTKARDQARAAYREGAIALMDVLTADAALVTATDRLTANRAGLARASVAAVRAMGGGYGSEGTDHG
ncbi:efflux transporter outer membrane subunit [Novosphingobium sp. FKTRR1]|uniref:efflux transporter outer membrane subunit n=1 Tax=Novosphingobium sp. FKTRR1 TaxID=2879118 RepID=UPI001CEFB77D|nr:TolC family protein [Novosphingobium sp. FKTRR1]